MPSLYAELGAVVVAKVELGEVAVQTSLADVVIHAVDAALEDGEEVLGRVGVHEAAEPHILVGGVVHALMGPRRHARPGKRRPA